MKRSAYLVLGLVLSMFFVLLSTNCLLIDDECVLEDSSGQQAIPTDAIPRAIDPAFRIVSPEVRAYFDNRLAQMEVVATTVTRRGSVYDWIDPRSQVPGGELGTPPPLDPQPDQSTSDDICRPSAVGGELEDEPEAWGPPGTVPVLRVDPDLIYAPGTVEDFLSKYGDASDIPNYDVPPQISTAGGHYHAAARHVGLNYGMEGYVSIWEPFSQSPREISVGQIAVYARDKSGKLIETIEAGYIVYAGRYGNYAVRFFVYFTTNGYTATGDKKGGADMEQAGWVQTSPTFTPGTILKKRSAPGGEQVEAYIRIELHEGKWWVRFNEDFVGYYPASLFSPGGLGTQAHGAQVHGETYDDPQIAGMTVTDMGSGKFPNPKSKRSSAYMRYLQIQTTVKGYDRPAFLSTHKWATNPNCYNFIDETTATDDWHSQFFYGGPGQNPKCP